MSIFNKRLLNVPNTLSLNISTQIDPHLIGTNRGVSKGMNWFQVRPSPCLVALEVSLNCTYLTGLTGSDTLMKKETFFLTF